MRDDALPGRGGLDLAETGSIFALVPPFNLCLAGAGLPRVVIGDSVD